MTKLILLNIGLGDLDRGFPAVTVQCWMNRYEMPIQFCASLPPKPELHRCYSRWNELYRALYNRLNWNTRIKMSSGGDLTNVSDQDFQELCLQFKQLINEWFSSEQFLEVHYSLRSVLQHDDDVQVIMQTDNTLLHRIPWHLWEFFENYPNSEISLSAPQWARSNPIRSTPGTVRILAIFGNAEGIDLSSDRDLFKELNGADVVFLNEPTIEKLDETLRNDKGWDILFFAGHSQTTEDSGWIHLNATESLTLSQVEQSLTIAISNGLQIAIFNSCDGLGLAQKLAPLNLPQVIVMREPIFDIVAQIFLRHLLKRLSKGKPLFRAVREARERLEILDYPCASWLPVIYQNPTAISPTWEALSYLNFGPTDCPYKGLESFQIEDATFFFGREAFTQKLLDAVYNKSVVAVVGASGSGKSSVVFAGLIPELLQDNHFTWDIVRIRPGQSPLETLSQALMTLIPISSDKNEVENSRLAQLDLEVQLQQSDVALSRFLRRKELLHNAEPNRQLLVVIDQFEELYTLAEDNIADRHRFLNHLLEAVLEVPNFKLVLTLRADFMNFAIQYRPFADILENNVLILGPLNQTELTDVILGPAKVCRVHFEAGLPELLRHEVGDNPENLPLLEFALTQLWQKQKHGQLTHKSYESFGGLRKALAMHAEKIYSELDSEQQDQAQRIFIRLVKPGQQASDTRNIVTRQEFEKEYWPLVNLLNSEEVRLLVILYDPKRGVETVEIVHEALLYGWERLRLWTNASREFRLWQEDRLKFSILQWQESNFSSDCLLRGAPLLVAQNWLDKNTEAFNHTEINFIQKSIEKREKQTKNNKRAHQLRIGIASGIAFVMTGVALFTNHQNQIITNQKILAELRESSAVVQNQVDGLPIKSIVLAIATVGKNLKSKSQILPEVESSLIKAVDQSRESLLIENIKNIKSFSINLENHLFISTFSEFTRLYDVKNKTFQPYHDDNIYQGDWRHDIFHSTKNGMLSPNGKYAVRVKSKNLELWNVKENLSHTLEKDFPHKELFQVVFSPKSDQFAILDPRGIKILNLKGQTIHTLSQAKIPFLPDFDTLNFSMINHLVYSPDSNRLAVILKGGDIGLWNINANNFKMIQLKNPFRNTNLPTRIIFSNNGQNLISSSPDGTIRLLNLNGKIIDTLKEDKYRRQDEFDDETPDTRLPSISSIPNSQKIAIVGRDKILRFWDFKENNIQTISKLDKPEYTYSIVFSPDGKYFAHAGSRRKIYLRNMEGDIIHIFTGHKNRVLLLAFSSNGQHIFSMSNDAIRRWDLESNPISKPGHSDFVTHLTFSTDGNNLISLSQDRILKLWEIDDNRIHLFQSILQTISIKPIYNRSHPMTVAVSPNGKYFVSVSAKDLLLLRDIKGEKIREFIIPETVLGDCNDLIFDSDGTSIISLYSNGNGDAHFLKWDLEGNLLEQRKIIVEPDLDVRLFFNTDRQIVTKDDNGIVSIFENTGRNITSFQINDESILSSNSQYVLTVSEDKTLNLWDINGVKKSSFHGHKSQITNAIFNPDRTKIVSGDILGNLYLWDRKGALLSIYPGHENGIGALTFRSDGHWLVSAGWDKTLKFWRVGNWQTWLQIGCNRLRSHPILLEPTSQTAKNAQATCNQYAWN